VYTLSILLNEIKSIPASVTWYLADISEAKGKQDLYIKQSPQRLKVLREHALIESAVSSNRIEGVEIDKSRIGTVLFGKPVLHDRNEEEMRGYRDALRWIHDNHQNINITENTIKKLHTLTKGEIWDAGKHKEKDSDIIERLPDGNTKIRFKTVLAAKTNDMMSSLIQAYNDCIKTGKVNPVIVALAFNFDFLCIHPFRDGNGRVSRLLLLLTLYYNGFQVGKYISLEKLIEENKERYYETLKISSEGWYEQKHDYWVYINFILFILKSAYTAFSSRLENIPHFTGSKTNFVITRIKSFSGLFTMNELIDKCPAISKDLIRKVVKDLQKKGILVSLGHGPGAKWKKKGNTLK
jgi:Fic family protein